MAKITSELQAKRKGGSEGGRKKPLSNVGGRFYIVLSYWEERGPEHGKLSKVLLERSIVDYFAVLIKGERGALKTKEKEKET